MTGGTRAGSEVVTEDREEEAATNGKKKKMAPARVERHFDVTRRAKNGTEDFFSTAASYGATTRG